MSPEREHGSKASELHIDPLPDIHVIWVRIACGTSGDDAHYHPQQLRRAIVEAKRLRKYFAGDFYPLTEESSDERAWCILQYDRPEQGDGMVIAFRRPRSPYPAFVLEELQGIDPAARYHVTWSTDYTPGKPQLLTGKQLQAARITIDQRPGSVVMEYRKVGAKAERGE